MHGRVYLYRWEPSPGATSLDCGGSAQRRHRFGEVDPRGQRGVALRFPPQSKMSACSLAAL